MTLGDEGACHATHLGHGRHERADVIAGQLPCLVLPHDPLGGRLPRAETGPVGFGVVAAGPDPVHLDRPEPGPEEGFPGGEGLGILAKGGQDAALTGVEPHVSSPLEEYVPGGGGPLHWWEEAEHRAVRQRGEATLALGIWRRLREAGFDARLSLLPAHGLARLYLAACDLVQVTDSLLVAPAGELSLHLYELADWCRGAWAAVEWSERPFLLLLDSLRPDPEDWPAAAAAGTGAEATGPAPAPEEAPKLEGRYERRHLLYERLDLRMEAEGLLAEVRRPLARDLATVYEEFLVTLWQVHGLLSAGERTRRRAWERLLVDVNATFHFHVGPRYLRPGPPEPGTPGSFPLPGWIALVLSGGISGPTAVGGVGGES